MVSQKDAGNQGINQSQEHYQNTKARGKEPPIDLGEVEPSPPYTWEDRVLVIVEGNSVKKEVDELEAMLKKQAGL